LVQRILTGPSAVKHIWIHAVNDNAKILTGKEVRILSSETYRNPSKKFYKVFIRDTSVSDDNVVTIADKYQVKIKYELSNGKIVSHDSFVNLEKKVTIAQIFSSEEAKLTSIMNIPISIFSVSDILIAKLNFIISAYIDNSTVRTNILNRAINHVSTDVDGNPKTVKSLLIYLCKVVAYCEFDYFNYEETNLKGTNFKRKVDAELETHTVDKIFAMTRPQKVESDDAKLLLYYANREAFFVDYLAVKLQNMLYPGQFHALQPEALVPVDDVQHIINVYCSIVPFVLKPAVAEGQSEEEAQQLRHQRERGRNVLDIFYHINMAISYYKS
jgi:hypothetical protein